MAPATTTSMAAPVVNKPVGDAPRRISSSHSILILMQGIYLLMFMLTLFLDVKSNKDDIKDSFRPSVVWVLNLGAMSYVFFLPVAIVTLLGVIMCNPFDQPKTTKTLYDPPFICFRAVTKGISQALVVRTILRNKNTCLSAGLTNFEIEAVTDNVLNLPKDNHIRETLVPSGYKSQNDTKFKGRALHYCLEPGVNHLANDDWVVHLDEESLLTEECIAGICEFIHENRGDIGQGPVTCSSAIGEVIPSWLSSLADCYRVGLDYCCFRFQLEFLNSPMFGFKGSYIVLKNKTGLEIGFDAGAEGSVTEDCYFALKAWTKGYRFGYIKGEIREQSPFSLMDFIRQRKRWFMGHVYICFAQNLPLTAKFGIIFDVICVIFVPFSLSAVIVNICYPFIPYYQFIIVSFVSGTMSGAVFIGTYMSFCDRQWSTLRLILVSMFSSLVAFPIGVVLHCIGAYWALATINTLEFHIVQKDANLFDEKEQ